MISFLLDLLGRTRSSCTVIVLDEESMDQPEQYRLHPRRLLVGLVTMSLLAAVALVLFLIYTPARTIVFGPDAEEVRQTARLNSIRTAALEDSLLAQYQYITQLRAIITGETEPGPEPGELPDDPVPAQLDTYSESSREARSNDWADHQQPALSFRRLVSTGAAKPDPAPADAYLASLRFPTAPPLAGFLARGFDAASGHYAVDIAVEEGTPVRAVGDGYVIFADWTHDGGYVISVQHADGFLSVYKHNSRLLKRVGDRVRSREAVALSGNTGEITTGPHLHFELWQNGLAQDPQAYFVGM
jgi:murein DD-endopeptidase MepM/ murein hydrolase activator NlpD